MNKMTIFGVVLAGILILIGILTKSSEPLFIGLFILLGCFMMFLTMVKAKMDEKE